MLMQPLPPAQVRIVGEVISSNPRRIISNIERGRAGAGAERAELDPCSAAVVWLRTASGGKFCLFVCLLLRGERASVGRTNCGNRESLRACTHTHTHTHWMCVRMCQNLEFSSAVTSSRKTDK